EPVGFLGREQRGLDEVEIERRERDCLEAEHLALRALDLAPLDDDEILEPDSIFARAIISGLVGEDHARLERRMAHLGDALRPLMHAEISADAMTHAVIEVEPRLPQRPSRHRIELRAGHAFGKDGGRDRDMPFQYACEMLAHRTRRIADGYRAGHVGRSV